MLRQRPVSQASFVILIILAGLTRHPHCRKTFVRRGNNMCPHLKEIARHKVFNFLITPHHQPEHRGLHPADRKHTVIPRITAEDGVGACHIDAVEPVCPCPCQCRNTQRDKITVKTHFIHCPDYRLRVKVIDQAALHLLTLFRRELQEIQYLIHQQLPFAIRVSGVDNFSCGTEQRTDGAQLFRHRVAGSEDPFLRDNRQISQVPAGITRIIRIRLCLLQQVADTPGHTVILTTADKAVPPLVRFG